MYLRSAPLQNTAPVPRKTITRIVGSWAYHSPAWYRAVAPSRSRALNRSRRSMVIVPTAPSRAIRTCGAATDGRSALLCISSWGGPGLPFPVNDSFVSYVVINISPRSCSLLLVLCHLWFRSSNSNRLYMPAKFGCRRLTELAVLGQNAVGNEQLPHSVDCQIVRFGIGLLEILLRFLVGGEV